MGPTASPTAAIPLDEPPNVPTTTIVSEFISGLQPYSLNLAENDASSPQAKALAWIRRDTMYRGYPLYRLYQQYALAVLYHSTSGESWTNSAGWLSALDECSWYTSREVSACDAGSRLTTLDLSCNRLDGSIPTESELLTEVGLMQFTSEASTFAVTIHPELYVRTTVVPDRHVFLLYLTICCVTTEVKNFPDYMGRMHSRRHNLHANVRLLVRFMYFQDSCKLTPLVRCVVLFVTDCLQAS
jgi:hypothetical protein